MKSIAVLIEQPDSPWPRRLWHTTGSVYARGYAHLPDGRIAERTTLADHFKVETLAAFRERLDQANGFFSVIVQTPTQLFAAVDRIRSIPLFYGVTASGELVISERAETVRIAVGDRVMDPQARAEFLHAGYVLGPRTLMPHVRQLQAGELLCYDRMTGDITTERYYRFLPTGGLDADETTLFNRLDGVYEDVFTRLIRWLDGRQAVIPLSGGYDSRLIALMLKELGYDNVLCFTYDTGGAKWETEISFQVAKKLGYRWECIGYSPLRWRRWYPSDELRYYLMAAANWVSLPHIQDWPAVQNLWHKNMSKDAVFVPGHTGDFISGGHIPAIWFDKSSITERDFCSCFSMKHFSLIGLMNDKQLEAAFDVLEIQAKRTELKWRAIPTWQLCEWQERQAKFIVNALRVYEWFGYTWNVPLWDDAVQEIWAKIPCPLLRSSTFHQRYVQSRGGCLPQPNPPKSTGTRLWSTLTRAMVKSSRYNLAELVCILRQSGFRPKSYLKMINGNGAATVNVLKLLKIHL